MLVHWSSSELTFLGRPKPIIFKKLFYPLLKNWRGKVKKMSFFANVFFGKFEAKCAIGWTFWLAERASRCVTSHLASHRITSRHILRHVTSCIVSHSVASHCVTSHYASRHFASLCVLWDLVAPKVSWTNPMLTIYPSYPSYASYLTK